MAIPQELYRLQSSLSTVFDRIGLTQEIREDFTLDEFTPQEQDQLALLIEKFESKLDEIRNNPSYIEEALDQRLLIRLGNYYYLQDNEIQALEYYELSNQVEENEWGYYNSAKILLEQEQLDLAFQRFDQAIKLKPDFPQALRHQAEILKSQGKDEAALDKLLKCQLLNPTDPETNKLLAEYHIAHGEKEEALLNLKAIHHRDNDVEEKIQQLEHKETFLGRLTSRFRKK